MTDKFTIFNMGLNGSFIKENGKIMEIERVVDLLNKGDHLKQSHKEILRDLEVTTFDKELLQKEKEGLYKENEQLKQRIKELEQEIEDLRMDNIRLNKCCDSFMKELGLNDDWGITVWF